jgi:flagellin-like protein
MRIGRRKGISELIATLIMIAVTLVAGSAAFGWILLQAGTSESSYGVSVANNVNFLNERFTLVSQSFSAGGSPCAAGKCTDANFWLYNTGSVDFSLFSIQVKNLTDTPATGTCAPTDGCYVNVVFTNTGFIAYTKNGAQLLPACSIGSGWNGGVTPLPQGKLSSVSYHITMPSGCPAPFSGPMYLYDGTTYTFTLTGLYGNIVTQQITPNG